MLAAVALPAPAAGRGDGAEAAAEFEIEPPKGAHDYGFAGLMARDNRTDLPPLTLSSGKPVAEGDLHAEVGHLLPDRHRRRTGPQELALSGGDFFRAIWINEIVIEDIEIRPMGVHSIEFDAAGTAQMSFIAIVPGTYTLSIPRLEQRAARARPSSSSEANDMKTLHHRRGRRSPSSRSPPWPRMAPTAEQMARIDEVLAGQELRGRSGQRRGRGRALRPRRRDVRASGSTTSSSTRTSRSLEERKE